jgi:hypothetical protein
MFERCRSPATCALAVLALAACHSGTQETVDAETADALTGDSSTDGIAAASRCSVTAARVTCDHVITPFAVGSDVRDVYWQTPVTPAPAGGYPIVLVYQGTNFPPAMTWDVLAGAPFGGYQQARRRALRGRPTTALRSTRPPTTRSSPRCSPRSRAVSSAPPMRRGCTRPGSRAAAT